MPEETVTSPHRKYRNIEHRPLQHATVQLTLYKYKVDGKAGVKSCKVIRTGYLHYYPMIFNTNYLQYNLTSF